MTTPRGSWVNRASDTPRQPIEEGDRMVYLRHTAGTQLTETVFNDAGKTLGFVWEADSGWFCRLFRSNRPPTQHASKDDAIQALTP